MPSVNFNNLRAIFFGYRNALNRKIPISKTHYIRAVQMFFVGWPVGVAAQAMIFGWWIIAAMWLIIAVLAACPSKYRQAKNDD